MKRSRTRTKRVKRVKRVKRAKKTKRTKKKRRRSSSVGGALIPTSLATAGLLIALNNN